MKILIVDDEPLISGDIVRVLTRAGFKEVHSVDNAKEALMELITFKPEVAILDINLQDKIDGIELARQFRQQKGRVLIMSTAYSDEGTINELKEVSPDALLVKPYNTSSLPGVIELAYHSKSEVGHKKEENEEITQVNDQATLFVKSNNIYERISLADVLYLEAQGSYCKLITKKREYTVSKNLNQLCMSLPGDVFVRIHRKYAVNLNYLKSFDSFSVKINENELPVSNSFKDSFLNRIRKI